MGLTIDQALQKGVKAHKAGRFTEARRFYDLALKTQPLHPDANHNIGAIEVSVGNLVKATPFFKNALEANPNNVQFWVSYIDVLIKIEAFDEARTLLTQAREKGARGEIFDQFEFKLTTTGGVTSITSIIEKFYLDSKGPIVNNAAQGWYYSAYFDTAFMAKKSANSLQQKPSETNNNTLKIYRKKTGPVLKAKQTLQRLNHEKNIAEKFKRLKALLKAETSILNNDSFTNNPDILTAQKQTFKNQELNIVIIGGGVTGLYVASAIKNTLGEDVNILVLDNRSVKQHTREPYKREWLTHIPAETVQHFSPPNIKKLLECFGTDGLIGLQINMLETILKLSCKDLGVKFFYSPVIAYKELTHSSIDFFIDATGGRLPDIDYPSLSTETNDVTLQNIVGNFNYTGIIPQNQSPNSTQNDFEVILKPSGQVHYPFINDTIIHTPMIKITGVPENLLQRVDDFIKPLNADNKFFIWKGALKADFNEGLIFINLTNKEFDLLQSHLNNPIKLGVFLKNNHDLLSSLHKDIISFIKMLAKLDKRDKIKIEQPFSYSPYINLNAGLGQLNGKPIYPIGDSYFTGNPKVGNGLWTHLGFINDFVRVINTVHKNSKG